MKNDIASLPRYAQYIAGVFILVLALSSAAVSLWINFQAGLIVGLSIACMLAISDLAKIVIPVVCRGIGWNLQTVLTYAAVSIASVICAFIFVKTQFDAEHAVADNLKANIVYADQRIADLRTSITATRKLVSDEADRGGCGKNCRDLNAKADKLETDLTKAVIDRRELPTKSAVPDRGQSLVLIIAGFVAMELIAHLAALGAALIGVATQQRNGAPRRNTPVVVDWTKPSAYMPEPIVETFVPIASPPLKLRKDGKPDMRYRAAKMAKAKALEMA